MYNAYNLCMLDVEMGCVWPSVVNPGAVSRACCERGDGHLPVHVNMAAGSTSKIVSAVPVVCGCSQYSRVVNRPEAELTVDDRKVCQLSL